MRLSTWVEYALSAVACGAIALSPGCTSVRATEGAAEEPLVKPVWPPAPAAARISFHGSYEGVQSLGTKVSLWRRLVNLITSDDRGRELFVKPLSVALDSGGNLCVADYGAKCIYYFDLKSRTCKRWSGIENENFESPVAAVKRGDVIYVADTKLEKIIGFTTGGRKKFEISEGLSRPSGLAVSADRLAVTDALLHRVVFYSLSGEFLYWFGDRGTAPGELNYPTHVALGTNGLVYVTDSMNSRVQVFNNFGVLVREIGSVGNTSGHFNRPKGVALDSESNVYVADAIFDNIQIFDPYGRFLMDFGTGGSEVGQFWMPSGVAISSGGLIYVADSYNHRLQAFQILEVEEEAGAK